MWDDEDNNPYGSFERHDASPSQVGHFGSPGGFRPMTPPSEASSPPFGSPEYITHRRDLSDVEYDDEPQEPQRIEPKKGGYDSRIEQILYENPQLPILITDAGKSAEGGGKYIVYAIRTGDLEVRRRYSEFASLRNVLVNLHPTLVIPPIPEKHTTADYVAKPMKAKEDVGIIELRKRMLAVFLNRCRRMQEVREDGVWWRFLDPNVSWSEVLHSHPVASLPSNKLKAPPLDAANPTPGHHYLPIPSASAKLRSSSGSASSGTPNSPPLHQSQPSTAAHTIPGPQIFGRFPPTSQNLSEEELDPYFVNFEASSKELEALLQGSMEKVNRRALAHLNSWGSDMAELGARYNAFALNEQSRTLSQAIEKMGQAVDSTYIQTGELSSALSAGFAEPMRESAQFAGIVRDVLRYRILKRVQEEMTKEELDRKRHLLQSLEQSEAEAKRIEQYLNQTGGPPPRRSNSAASQRSNSDPPRPEEDAASIDSDFPPTHGESHSPPSAAQGQPHRSEPSSPVHKKTPSGNFVTSKIFGRVSHAFHGIVDVDPERTRRDQIGKTRESITQLEQALEVAEKDVKDASVGVLKDLKRFQSEKEEDLRRYMIAFAKCHIEWAKRNQASWEEAKAEIQNIQAAPTE
ncbi:sorting nexin-41 [Diplodia corticola]|uniref:Sorting nexin-41 n=1 Tax=Diplodia corticola TaxID=236234 RepID=A0A1J9R2N7_9PEZI|nr:sorting nexin-41 [Diplodia corticola]OJD34880.1 sorting nexin-41 [Diplodia corticola]